MDIILGLCLKVYIFLKLLNFSFANLTLSSMLENAKVSLSSSIIFFDENSTNIEFHLSKALSIFCILPIMNAFHTVAPEALSIHSTSKMSGMDDSILFSSGYTANLGVISGLIRANNLIIHDKLNHASLLDGTVMSGAKMIRYKHGDISHLESLLKDNSPKYPEGILVVTDGVFSMDGDIAKLPLILETIRKYNAVLLIDEAHATGVIGDNGAGTLSHYGITDRKNIILTGTLSKAIGTVGGYITASQDIIDYLRIYARSNMFSTSLPPSVCAAAIEVIKVMQNTNIVERLKQNAKYLQHKFRDGGFNILNTETPIIPLVVGDQAILTQMAKDAFDNGFVLNSIFPPVVPANLTRFRISIMANHTQKDMDMLFELMIKLFDKYNVPRFVR